MDFDVRFDILYMRNGEIGASFQIENANPETFIWTELNEESPLFSGVAKAKSAVDALLPGLIEAASQADEIASLKAKLEAKDARIAELEAQIAEDMAEAGL